MEKKYAIENNGEKIYVIGPAVENWEAFLKEVFKKEVAPKHFKNQSKEILFAELLQVLGSKGYSKYEPEKPESVDFNSGWGYKAFKKHHREGFSMRVFRIFYELEYKKHIGFYNLPEEERERQEKLIDENEFLFIEATEDKEPEAWKRGQKRITGEIGCIDGLVYMSGTSEYYGREDMELLVIYYDECVIGKNNVKERSKRQIDCLNRQFKI